MHDGYIFTLGICGATGIDSPVLKLFDTMLAILPPVKRAALLGSVMPLDQNGRWYDPLIDPIIADMLDAEVLLIVTPVLRDGHIPSRMEMLFRCVEGALGLDSLHGKYAAFVGLISSDEQRVVTVPVWDRFCHYTGIKGVSVVYSFTTSICGQAVLHQVEAMARDTYSYADAALRARDITPLR